MKPNRLAVAIRSALNYREPDYAFRWGGGDSGQLYAYPLAPFYSPAQ